MKPLSFDMVRGEISQRLDEAFSCITEIGYELVRCSEREFFDYMTGEIFSEDKTTIRDVLENRYLMIHEVVEISELKKLGLDINLRVIIDSPRELIYQAHFYAMNFELEYLQISNEPEFFMKRINDHYCVLTSDPWLPESMMPVAREIWMKFKPHINDS